MPDASSETLTLGQKQRLFARLLGRLLTHVIEDLGYELTMADGSIDQIRKGQQVGGTGDVVRFKDRVHMDGGQHYCRLAQDLNLFVNGIYVEDGGDPAWSVIGTWWEAQHPLCRWGGRFRDANHFSLEHNGNA